MEKSTSTNVILKVTSAILRIFLNIIFYVLVVWLVIKAGKFTYDFSYQLFGSVTADTEPGRDVDFHIQKGDTSMEVANKLENAHLIVNKYSFYLKMKLKDYNIYPGTYILNTSMDYDEILKVITDLSNSITTEEDTETDTDTDSNVNTQIP